MALQLDSCWRILPRCSSFTRWLRSSIGWRVLCSTISVCSRQTFLVFCLVCILYPQTGGRKIDRNLRSIPIRTSGLNLWVPALAPGNLTQIYSTTDRSGCTLWHSPLSSLDWSVTFGPLHVSLSSWFFDSLIADDIF